jgi:hypothetical protein
MGLGVSPVSPARDIWMDPKISYRIWSWSKKSHILKCCFLMFFVYPPVLWSNGPLWHESSADLLSWLTREADWAASRFAQGDLLRSLQRSSLRGDRLFIGKSSSLSSINGPFSIAMLNNRVYDITCHWAEYACYYYIIAYIIWCHYVWYYFWVCLAYWNIRCIQFFKSWFLLQPIAFWG